VPKRRMARLLCIAIVGGAIRAASHGAAADRTSLASALLVPAVCYVGVAIMVLWPHAGLGLVRMPPGPPSRRSGVVWINDALLVGWKSENCRTTRADPLWRVNFAVRGFALEPRMVAVTE